MADEKDKKPEPTQYTPEQLIEESRALLGCSSHVAVGALHGTEASTLTAAEGKAAVRSFLKRKAVMA